MKSIPCLLGLLLLASPALAADYRVGSGSTLGFTASFQGENFEGRFEQFSADIRYDPQDLANAHFDVSIDLASAKTGDADRDETLPSAAFFDVAKQPKAHFVTTAFRQAGAGVIADGTLSLKGVSKPVSLKVEFTPGSAGAATLKVSTTLKRLDFDVGSGEYADTGTIGNEVAVKAQLNLEAK